MNNSFLYLIKCAVADIIESPPFSDVQISVVIDILFWAAKSDFTCSYN